MLEFLQLQKEHETFLSLSLLSTVSCQSSFIIHPPMSLTAATAASGGGRTFLQTPTTTTTTRVSCTCIPNHPQFLFPFSPRTRRSLHKVSAKKKFSPRTGRLDSENRRRSELATKEQEAVIEMVGPEKSTLTGNAAGTLDAASADGYFLPDLPGDKPDFWEGPQWDGLGFFVQYMWAFGVLFGLISSGIAVATYNEGATDFKDTPAFKESIQSQELLEEPEAFNTDVFESNPTEVAPSLE